MKATLRGHPCGSAMSEKLITRALSNLTVTTRPQFWTCPSCQRLPGLYSRASSSSSSSQWKSRQSRDHYARDAKVQGLKSRAAYKLLEVRECFSSPFIPAPPPLLPPSPKIVNIEFTLLNVSPNTVILDGRQISPLSPQPDHHRPRLRTRLLVTSRRGTYAPARCRGGH